MTPRLLDQFKGCMIGGLIGDCLGANFECRYESLVPREKIDKFFNKIKAESFSQVQKYTDDSAMAKQIAQSFIDNKSFDYKDVARRFSREYHREPWRGYGGSVVEVFTKLHADPADHFAPASQQFNGSGSYGNGAGMRAHPIALAAHGLDTENIILNAVNIGRLTHAHHLGIGGGVLQTLAVSQALVTETPEEILQSLRREIRSFEGEERSPDYSHKLQLVEEYIHKPDSDLAEIGFELGNDVSALESVPTALFCFLRGCKKYERPVQFEETIRLAIHLGGDTDTIASMAGAITGAYLGYQHIPESLHRHCEAREEVLQQAEQIYNIVRQQNLSAGGEPANGGAGRRNEEAEGGEMTSAGGEPPVKRTKSS